MRHVLAVDGGQSTIRVRHSGHPRVAEVEGVSRLEGDTLGTVAAAVVEGWRSVGAPPVERVVLGLTTAPTDVPSRQRLCGGVATQLDALEVWLADDAVTSHAGALSLDRGVSITAGTGVACLAMAPDGTTRIIGGHGFLLGDEGGAFWIGREGIRAVLRAHDGHGPSTALDTPAADHFDGLDDLSDRLHSSARPVHTIASFAPRVLDSASAGDAVAMAIVEAASRELSGLARAACSFASPQHESVSLALGGRLLGGGLLRDRLEHTVRSEMRWVLPRSADGSPLDGAAMLGATADPGPYRDRVYVWRAP